jgi:hypothetical protein
MNNTVKAHLTYFMLMITLLLGAYIQSQSTEANESRIELPSNR